MTKKKTNPLSKLKTDINTWIRRKRRRSRPDAILRKDLEPIFTQYTLFVNQIGITKLVNTLNDAQMMIVLQWILKHYQERLTFKDEEQDGLSVFEKELQDETVSSIEMIVESLQMGPHCDFILIRKKIEYMEELEADFTKLNMIEV